MIGFPIGLVYANAMEWFIHKHMLHGMGKNKNSYWSFHWHDHHNSARKNDMFDDVYSRPLWEWNAHSKEVLSLFAGAAVHAPLFPIAPFFTMAVWASAANYYRVHRKAHTDPAWGKENLPWHVDHHMGMNQHANWCVTFPLWDKVMRTREKYLGTQKQKDDVERERVRREIAQQAA